MMECDGSDQVCSSIHQGLCVPLPRLSSVFSQGFKVAANYAGAEWKHMRRVSGIEKLHLAEIRVERRNISLPSSDLEVSN
jgi:hypothetical protein